MSEPRTSARAREAPRQPLVLRGPPPHRRSPRARRAPAGAARRLSRLRGGPAGHRRRDRGRPRARLHRDRQARLVARAADAARHGHALHGDDVRGGAARGGSGHPRGGVRRVRPGQAAGPPRAPTPCHGLLHLQQRRGRGPVRAARARARPRRNPRLGRPPRERDAGRVLGRRLRVLRLPAPVAVLPGQRRPRGRQRDDPQRAARGRVRRRGDRRGDGRRRRARARSRSRPTSCSCRPGSTPPQATRSEAWR